jgi:hypothetical protein
MPTYGPLVANTVAEIVYTGGTETVWDSVFPSVYQVTDNVYGSNQPWTIPVGPGTTTARDSKYLLLTNFGFVVPSAETVTAITVEGMIWSDFGGATPPSGSAIRDESIVLYRSGALTGNLATGTDWPTTKALKTWTFTTGLPSISDINASNFGLALAIQGIGGPYSTPFVAPEGLPVGRIDMLTITVTTTGSGAAKELPIRGNVKGIVIGGFGVKRS